MTSNQDPWSLSPETERAYVIDFYVLAPMTAMLAIIILVILRKDRKALQVECDSNPYTQYTWRCAQAACLLVALLEFTKIFFCNNLIVPWDYNAARHRLISVTDSIALSMYFAVKTAFYFGFTYHFQSILYAHDESSRLSLGIKVMMVFVGIYFTVAAGITIAMDAATYSGEEIGASQLYHVYFNMIYIVNPASLPVCAVLLLIDIGYFFVLFYFYISKAMKARNGKKKAIRGLLLAITSCTFFWILLVFNMFDSPFTPIAAVIDVAADIICLFALFQSGSLIYDNVCGCSCETLFASKYRQLADQNGTDDEMLPDLDDEAAM